MLTFVQAGHTLQFILQALLFIAAICQLFFTISAVRAQKRALPIARDAVLFAVLLAFTAVVHDAFQAAAFRDTASVFADLPVAAVAAVALTAFLAQLARAVYLLRFKPPHVGPNSIKEAVDTLPVAVAYFSADGALALANLRMHRLYASISPYALQSYGELKRSLEQLPQAAPSEMPEAPAGVVRIAAEARTRAEAPGELGSGGALFRFPAGQVWRYAQQAVRTDAGAYYKEVTFSDVTELYAKRREIEEQTRRLRAVSESMRALSESKLNLMRESELLAAKTALHDRLGASLTALRRCLEGSFDAAAADSAVGALQRAATDLRADAEYQAQNDELTEFIRDAAFVRVQVSVQGSLPEDPARRRLFMAALRECLTNAVRHANATALDACITQSHSARGTGSTLCISNNGTPPTGPVVPAGGLANIAAAAARLGGTMDIALQPRFTLTVNVPQSKEDIS